MQTSADAVCHVMWQVRQLPPRELRQQQKPAKKLPPQETQSLACLSPVLSSRLSSLWRATWVGMTLTWAKQVPAFSIVCRNPYTVCNCNAMVYFIAYMFVETIDIQWFCGVVRCCPAPVGLGNKPLLASVLACLGNTAAVQKACHFFADLHKIRHLSRCMHTGFQAVLATGLQTCCTVSICLMHPCIPGLPDGVG